MAQIINHKIELRASLAYVRAHNPFLDDIYGIDGRDENTQTELTMLTAFGKQIWPPPPPTDLATAQRNNDLNYRVTSMTADVLGAMHSTIAQQPREKNMATQQSEMGLGMGGHSANAHVEAHPLIGTHAYFSGIDPNLNPDPNVNRTAADEYNLRLQKQLQHQARLAQSSAPTFTR